MICELCHHFTPLLSSQQHKNKPAKKKKPKKKTKKKIENQKKNKKIKIKQWKQERIALTLVEKWNKRKRLMLILHTILFHSNAPNNNSLTSFDISSCACSKSLVICASRLAASELPFEQHAYIPRYTNIHIKIKLSKHNRNHHDKTKKNNRKKKRHKKTKKKKKNLPEPQQLQLFQKHKNFSGKRRTRFDKNTK